MFRDFYTISRGFEFNAHMVTIIIELLFAVP